MHEHNYNTHVHNKLIPKHKYNLLRYTHISMLNACTYNLR